VKISIEDIKSDMRKIAKEIGKIPSMKDYTKYGHYGKVTVQRLFGGYDGWNKTLLDCFDKTLQKTPEPPVLVICLQCGTEFKKCVGEIKKTKNHFCCSSHAATYNNTHRKTGYRRSKLEVWAEGRLKELYPQLTIICNEKAAINSELDIFLPDLQLAFELNGIFHYEPIHGDKK